MRVKVLSEKKRKEEEEENSSVCAKWGARHRNRLLLVMDRAEGAASIAWHDLCHTAGPAQRQRRSLATRHWAAVVFQLDVMPARHPRRRGTVLVLLPQLLLALRLT